MCPPLSRVRVVSNQVLGIRGYCPKLKTSPPTEAQVILAGYLNLILQLARGRIPQGQVNRNRVTLRRAGVRQYRRAIAGITQPGNGQAVLKALESQSGLG